MPPRHCRHRFQHRSRASRRGCLADSCRCSGPSRSAHPKWQRLSQPRSRPRPASSRRRCPPSPSAEPARVRKAGVGVATIAAARARVVAANRVSPVRRVNPARQKSRANPKSRVRPASPVKAGARGMIDAPPRTASRSMQRACRQAMVFQPSLRPATALAPMSQSAVASPGVLLRSARLHPRLKSISRRQIQAGPRAHRPQIRTWG